MIKKIETLITRYRELTEILADPSVINEQAKFRQLSREYNELRQIVNKYQQYNQIVKQITEDEKILQLEEDRELKQMAKAEIDNLRNKKERIEEELKLIITPKDPDDKKNAIIEIRAGTGGEEAALFALDLFRMYNKYCEQKGWKIELMNTNPTGLGGLKEVIFLVCGEGSFGHLKYESGVHRVQRIPVTEAGGRIHTSAATVAVLPEAEEIDLKIDPKDLRIDTFCSKGHGGQSVNTTYSAIRITHLPSGLVVTCQDERSQLQNKIRAMKVLCSRLLEKIKQEQTEKTAIERRQQVKTGDRSEKIRTYNFPQNRLTDHRIGLTLYKLDRILDGELDELIEALTIDAQKREMPE
ncbi:MAG: peptide chain release factor 1 [Candidatus Edwardsbacteria bacterium]